MRSFGSILSLVLASASLVAARPKTTSTTTKHSTTSTSAVSTSTVYNANHARPDFPQLYYVSGMTLDIGEEFLFPSPDGYRLIQQFTG